MLRRSGRATARASTPWTITTGLAATMLIAGAAIGIAIAPVKEPGVLAAGPRDGLLRVTTETFSDPVQVQLLLTRGRPQDVTSPASGVVTAFGCRPGEPLHSGSVAVRIDARPLIALATRIPLWRDLPVGLDGPDVTALQRELHRLGLSGPATGRMDSATAAAVVSRLRSAGRTHPPSRVRRADILWIPQSRALVQECLVSVGDSVSAGTPLATTVPRLVSVHVAMTDGLVSGQREVEVGPVTAQVDDTGRVSSPKLLRQLERLPEVSQSSQLGDRAPVQGTLKLEVPLTVSSLPASAVIVATDGTTCVLSAMRKPIDVEIVSSLLGRSLVVWRSASTRPAHVLASPPRNSTC